MPKRISLRTLTVEEERETRRLANSRSKPASLVKRANVIRIILDEPKIPPSRAGQLAGFVGAQSGIDWVRRFNAAGIDGLNDKPRPGKPRTHSEQVRGQLVSLALQKPDSLGYPFALWTLERLQIAFRERHDAHLSDSTIWTWMDEEGFKWKRQQSWFDDVERHDPEFVEKRG